MNGLPRLLRHDLGDEQQRTVGARVISLKLGVMKPLWAQDWGSFSSFKEWAEGCAHAPVPKGLEAAAAYFHAGREGMK